MVRLVAWAGLVLLVGACGSDANQVTVGVVDSAGVRIVQHGALQRPLHDIRLIPEPVYRVGWDTADYQFAHIFDGVLLEDGGAAIADLMNREAVLIGPGGESLGVLGTRGQGPGELASVDAVAALGDDSIVVQDDRNARFTVFHGRSAVRSFPNQSGGWLRLIGVLDGLPILRSVRHYPNFTEPWLLGALGRLDMLTGAADTVRRFYYVPNRRNAKKFGPGGVIGVSRDAILVGRSDYAEIEWVSPQGRLAQIVRWVADMPCVTEADWAAYEQYFMTDPIMAVDTKARRELFARMRAPLGEELPYFGTLFGDDDGRAWVGDYSVNWRTTPRFEVFAPDGAWMGSLSLPAGLQVLDIRANRMLAAELSETGVPSIVVYDIEWT